MDKQQLTRLANEVLQESDRSETVNQVYPVDASIDWMVQFDLKGFPPLPVRLYERPGRLDQDIKNELSAALKKHLATPWQPTI
jgi:hypothetical protein